MNTRLTWLLLLIASVLGGYIYLADFGPSAQPAASTRAMPFLRFEAGEVSAVELLRSNTPLVRVVREGPGWRMRLPIACPAQKPAIEALLEALDETQPSRWLSVADLGTNSLASFGLEATALTVKLEVAGRPVLLQLGGQAPVGEQFYLKQDGTDGVFVMPNALLAKLPRSADHWRDRSLLSLEGVAYDRFEVRGKTPGFEAQKDASGSWRLTKPLLARADSSRIETVINSLRSARVVAFLSDSPKVDLEPLGLQPPENEFILGRGTNDLVRIQIGNIPADATNFVRVRLPATTNLVLAPVAVGQLARLALANFRDRQLLPPLKDLTRIELRAGTNRAALETRGTNWAVVAPAEFPAAGDLVRYWLEQLPAIGIQEFVNDVVADYVAYGLDQPVREYRFLTGTNVLAHLQFGQTNGPEHIFVRRLDEPGVYSVGLGVFLQQPEAAGQFRELRFAESNVTRVAISRLGKTRMLERTPQGEWVATAGSPPVSLSPAIEETLHRLGVLQSLRYAVPDESQFTRLPSYQRLGHEFTLTLGGQAGLRSLRIRLVADLGASAVALVHADDAPEPLRIELPGPLAQDLQREFTAQ